MLSKELLLEMQWYYTRESHRLAEYGSFPSEIQRYSKCLKFLEEIRQDLENNESNNNLPR